MIQQGISEWSVKWHLRWHQAYSGTTGNSSVRRVIVDGIGIVVDPIHLSRPTRIEHMRSSARLHRVNPTYKAHQ